MPEEEIKEKIKQNKSKPAQKIILISLAVGCLGLPTLVIAGFLGYKLLTSFIFTLKPINCRALTPLFLDELYTAIMIKPIYGEKCDLNKDNFLLRLAYKDPVEAANAALGLRIASSADQRYEDYIMAGQDAAAFYAFEDKVYLVVMPGIGKAKKVESFLKKLTAKKALAGFVVPTATSDDITNIKDEVLEKAIEEANKPTPTLRPTVTPILKNKKSTTIEIPTKVLELPVDEPSAILAAAHSYVSKNSAPGLQFTLTFKKQVGNYAMVYVEPEPGTADSAGVILEKISGQWVGQTMGTIFPEWEEKVPELFR